MIAWSCVPLGGLPRFLPRRSILPCVLPCVVALAATLSAAIARADEIDRCLAAHPEAQRLRQDGKLGAAREQLLVCAREVCPQVVRSECGQWIAEVDALIPSVVISARTATGADLSDVRVFVDDQPRLQRLDGRELSLDPGPHTLRLEAPGLAPVEQMVLVREREKARPVLFTMLPVTGPESGPENPVLRNTPGAPSVSIDNETQVKRPVPLAVYLLGGVGVAALGSFTYFGLTGRSRYFDLEHRCSPSCTSSDVAPVKTDLLIADVSLGVSLVTLGAAAYFYFTRPPAPAKPSPRATGLHVGIDAQDNGASTSMAWSF